MDDGDHEIDARYPGRIDLMSGLSEADADRLRTLARSVDLDRGETLYRHEDGTDVLFLVRSGAIKLFRASEDGKEVTLVVVGPGDLFGEQAFAGQSSRGESAEALEPSAAWALDAAQVALFAQRRPSVALWITRVVGNRLKRIEARMQDILFGDVRARLAHTLAELALDFGDQHTAGRRIRHHLTQTDLAELIGSTRETTSTVFNEFRRDGLVDREDGLIVVSDLEALRHYPGDDV